MELRDLDAHPPCAVRSLMGWAASSFSLKGWAPGHMAGPCQRWRTALQGVLTVTRLKKPSDKGVAWCEEAKQGLGALRG